MADSNLRVAITAEFGGFLSQLRTLTGEARSGFAQVGIAITAMGTSAKRGFTELEEGAKKVKEANKQLSELKETVKRAAEALVLFEAVRFGKEAISSSLELGEHLRNLALQTGISTKHLQELQYAAAATGQDMDRLVLASQQLSRAYRQLQNPNGAPQVSAALNVFGLRPSDLQDTYGTLVKISDAMQRVGANGVAVRAALGELFGQRSGARLTPLLANFRELRDEFQKSGLLISDESLNKLEETKKSFNVLGFVWQQDKAILTAELTPALFAFAKIFTVIGEQIAKLQGNKGMEQFADELADKMIDLAEKIYTTIIPALKEIIKVAQDAGKVIEFAVHPLTTTGNFIASKTGYTFSGQKYVPSVAEGIDKTNPVIAELEKLRPGATTESLSKATKTAEELGKAGTGPQFVIPRKPSEILADFVAEKKLEEAEHEKDADFKIAIEEQIYNKTVALFGATSKEARKAALDVVKATQERIAEQQRLELNAIQNQEKIAQAGLSLRLAAIRTQTATTQREIQAQLQLRQLSLSEEVALLQKNADVELDAERKSEQEKYDLKKKFLDETLAELRKHADLNKEAIQKTNADIQAAEIEHQAALADIIAKGAEKRAQIEIDAAKKVQDAWTKALDPIASGLNNTIDSLLKGENPGQTALHLAGEGIKGVIHSGVTGIFTGGEQGSLAGGISKAIFGQGQGLAGILAGATGQTPGETMLTAANTFSAAVDRFAGFGGPATGGKSGSIGDILSGAPSTSSILGVLSGSPDSSTIAGALTSGAGDALDLASGGAAGTGLSFLDAAGIAGGSASGSGLGGLFGLAGSAIGSIFGGSGSGIGSSIGSAVGALLPLALSFFEQGGIVSAAGGAIVNGNGVMARLHDEEMVLPKPLSKGIQGIIDSRGEVAGGPTVNFTVHAIDSESFGKHLDKHAGRIYDMFNRGVRLSDSRLVNAGSRR